MMSLDQPLITPRMEAFARIVYHDRVTLSTHDLATRNVA